MPCSVRVVLVGLFLISLGCRAPARRNPLGFTFEAGQYEAPDIVVRRANPPVRQLDCPGRVVVYAPAIQVVPNCNGFLFVFPANNPLVLAALTRAATFARASLRCPGDCQKVLRVLWVGWDCGGNPPLTAIAAVELEVSCVLPVPPAELTAFAPESDELEDVLAPLFLETRMSGTRR